MAEKIPYISTRLWLRVYDNRILTEEGAFASLPTDFGGSQLEVEFNQILVFGDSNGTFYEYRIFDFDSLLDQQRNTGTGYQFTLFDYTYSAAPTGPSTFTSDWQVEFLESNFNAAELSALEAQYKRFQVQLGQGTVEVE